MGSILRPAAKTLIKGGMVFYRETLSEMGEMATDLVAEARAELNREASADQRAPAKTAARPAQEHHATA
jgi:capsid protein